MNTEPKPLVARILHNEPEHTPYMIMDLLCPDGLRRPASVPDANFLHVLVKDHGHEHWGRIHSPGLESDDLGFIPDTPTKLFPHCTYVLSEGYILIVAHSIDVRPVSSDTPAYGSNWLAL